MQANNPYPILKTTFYFTLISSYIIIFVSLFWLWLENTLTDDPEKVVLMSWQVFLFILYGSLILAGLNGIILALLKFRVDKISKYLWVCLLAFCVPFPISFIYIFSFEGNKSLGAWFFLSIATGIPCIIGNLIASKFTLPKA